MENNEQKNNSLESYFWASILVYMLLFFFYMMDTTTGLQPIVKDGHTTWVNSIFIGDDSEYKLYQQLKMSSYLLLFLWVLFYMVSLVLYIILFQQGFDVVVKEAFAIYVKISIGYVFFIFIPAISFTSIDSTFYKILEGIGVIGVALLGILPQKKT